MIQKRDRLFIVLTGILVILFASEIFANISRYAFNKKATEARSISVNIDAILARIKQAGLVPREARYYKVIE